ncbi:TPA: hypothetical protein DF272_00490 [Candidatus Falkowbacteria bacterium]|nr:hypothetical protein [Candidatus Falkowbacteria bacterium]
MFKQITIWGLIMLGLMLVGGSTAQAQDIAQVKAVCVSIAGTSGFLDTCDEIDTAATIEQAQNICQEVATAVLDDVMVEDGMNRCEDAAIGTAEPSPASGDGEVSEEEALQNVYSGISRFGGKGFIGTELSVPEVIGGILKVILGIVGALALVMFIYGGLMFMLSEGETGKIKTAKDIIIWASLGLLTIFGSFAVLNFVISNL